MLVTVYCRVITLSCSDFREPFQNSWEKGRVSQFIIVFHSIERYPASRIRLCLCGGKSVVQKFVLEFRFHSLGSVLCKRKKCSAKSLCWNSEPIP